MVLVNILECFHVMLEQTSCSVGTVVPYKELGTSFLLVLWDNRVFLLKLGFSVGKLTLCSIGTRTHWSPLATHFSLVQWEALFLDLAVFVISILVLELNHLLRRLRIECLLLPHHYLRVLLCGTFSLVGLKTLLECGCWEEEWVGRLRCTTR